MWKIKLNKGQRIYFTSDTHYNHTNLCKGISQWSSDRRTRPYSTLDQMNAAIVNGINNKVGQDDILISLGDWSFGGFDSIKEFKDRLVCKNIYLIFGNHDHHIERNIDGCQGYFVKTAHYSEVEITRMELLTPVKYDFVLSHYPMCSWNGMNKGKMHLFGHVHLPNNYKIMPGRAMDVGVEGNNMEPYEVSEINKLLKNQPIKSTSLKIDHHESDN